MDKKKVFVTRPDIPPSAMEMLKSKFQVTTWKEETTCPRTELLQSVKGIDGLFCQITDKIDKELMDAAGPSLKVIGTMSVGYDHIDPQEAKRRNIKIGNTPGVLTDATAETAISILLATSRRLFEANEELRNGGWIKSSWGPSYLVGHGLSGSTVGIYGLGRIGLAVLQRLKPFNVSKFLYSGRSPKPEVKDADFVSFETLCKESDFIIVTCALNAETKGKFNEAAFSMMKPEAIFINVSRGATVDQDALIKALKENRICSAGLDVMTPEPLPLDHPLTKLKNCVLIPHIGSATIRTRRMMGELTSQNIIAGLEESEMPAQLKV